ncbi:hypothetical protein Tco_0907669 [Tanacetum coccineum]|uniref:Uncharacterized protein n=1 Tax=Tanacetum coccineum TaxID=301880 RepID=A0ABQ5CL04_9ASTR
MSSSFRSNPGLRLIYSRLFFGMQSPFGGTGESHGGNPFPRSMFGDDIFSQQSPFGGEGSASMPRTKGAMIERTLPCSLEDLFMGTTKKMKISRDLNGLYKAAQYDSRSPISSLVKVAAIVAGGSVAGVAPVAQMRSSLVYGRLQRRVS